MVPAAFDSADWIAKKKVKGRKIIKIMKRMLLHETTSVRYKIRCMHRQMPTSWHAVLCNGR